MAKLASPRRPAVCLLSFNPLLLAEFRRLLPSEQFRLIIRRSEANRMPDSELLRIPRASIHVVEAHTHRQVTDALVGAVLSQQPRARVIVVGEKFAESSAFPLLRLGAKGLVTYSEVDSLLSRAVKEVASGGFWVPRALLSRFVDLAFGSTRRPQPPFGSADLSRRERQVMELLLENLPNKEIAKRLNVSERTAKFHVSNLLAKYGVKRRADLILLCYTHSDLANAGP